MIYSILTSLVLSISSVSAQTKKAEKVNFPVEQGYNCYETGKQSRYAATVYLGKEKYTSPTHRYEWTSAAWLAVYEKPGKMFAGKSKYVPLILGFNTRAAGEDVYLYIGSLKQRVSFRTYFDELDQTTLTFTHPVSKKIQKVEMNCKRVK